MQVYGTVSHIQHVSMTFTYKTAYHSILRNFLCWFENTVQCVIDKWIWVCVKMTWKYRKFVAEEFSRTSFRSWLLPVHIATTRPAAPSATVRDWPLWSPSLPRSGMWSKRAPVGRPSQSRPPPKWPHAESNWGPRCTVSSPCSPPCSPPHRADTHTPSRNRRNCLDPAGKQSCTIINYKWNWIVRSIDWLIEMNWITLDGSSDWLIDWMNRNELNYTELIDWLIESTNLELFDWLIDLICQKTWIAW